MDEILQASDNSFEELDYIPDREKLTFTNGFYVNCSALFIDIRGSSSLTDFHRRPKLAKLYRVYISEVVALMNDNDDCREVNIVGDGISGIFNTPYKVDVNGVFATAFSLSSLIDILNFKFEKYGIQQISVGIGLDYGRALMIKAGHKGSGINDVIWMGDVVNSAAKLCGYGNATSSDCEIMTSYGIYTNLSEANQSLLSWNYHRQCYHGYVVSKSMNEWLQQQRQ